MLILINVLINILIYLYVNICVNLIFVYTYNKIYIINTYFSEL